MTVANYCKFCCSLLRSPIKFERKPYNVNSNNGKEFVSIQNIAYLNLLTVEGSQYLQRTHRPNRILFVAGLQFTVAVSERKNSRAFYYNFVSDTVLPLATDIDSGKVWLPTNTDLKISFLCAQPSS